MACIRPITVYSKYSSFPVQVPCRTCTQCRASRTSEWTARLKYEYNHCSSAAFVRLSYDDLHLEYYKNDRNHLPSLRRDTMHKFIDRLRHWCKRHSYYAGVSKNFRYFACGEYGDEGSRPHYHLCLFGIDWRACRKVIKKNWPFGFVQAMPLKVGAFRYVMKYMEKQVYGDLNDKLYFDNYIEAPFFSYTPGIGSGLYANHQKEINAKGYLTFGVHRKVFPNNYYRKKFTNMTFYDTMNREAHRIADDDILWRQIKSDMPSIRSIEDYQAYVSKVRDDNTKVRMRRDCRIIPI